MRYPQWAYAYAIDVLRRRWPEGEVAIKQAGRGHWLHYCKRFGLNESEEIPDLDADALSPGLARTWQHVCADAGLKECWTDHYALLDYYDCNGNVIVEFEYPAGPLTVKGVAPGNTSVFRRNYEPTYTDGIARAIQSAIRATAPWREQAAIQESEEEIPDLDVDALAAPSFPASEADLKMRIDPRVLSPGCYSSGTCNPEHVVPQLLRIIDFVEPGFKERELADPENAALADWINGDGEPPDDLIEYWDDLDRKINDDHVPPYCYWGGSEGDGAAIGVWVSSESLEEACRCREVVRLDSLSEWTDQVTGDTDYVWLRPESGSDKLIDAKTFEVVWAL